MGKNILKNTCVFRNVDISFKKAWTRALLGICAKEIHICGDPTAIDLIEEMCLNTGDVFELKKYDRLTPLKFLNKSLDDLKHVQPGDCIVCFNKKNIFQVTEELRLLKKQFSVIYGSLPPSVKLAEARRFNDPQDPCKILVATDAIGMVRIFHILKSYHEQLKNYLLLGFEFEY